MSLAYHGRIRAPNSLDARPISLGPIFEAIPAELVRQGQRFATWIPKPSGDKWTKLPIDPHTGKGADSTDPATWTTFEEAQADYRRNRRAGIMFALSPDDLIVALDFDHCVAEDGAIDPEIEATARRFNTYTEFSPSGTGLRLILRGVLPAHGRKKGPVEVYADKRFMTLTGHRLDGTPATIEDRPRELGEWHLEVFGPPPDLTVGPALPSVPVDLDDVELIEKAKAAKNGDRFARLWAGDTSDHAGDDSAANLALCNHLAFYTGRDSDRIDRLFRQSGLMRSKWDEPRGPSTWGRQTIELAIAGCRETYAGPTDRNLRPVAECPPELVGTPDEPCKVRIRELENEVRDLRARIRELEVEASLKDRILTKSGIPAGERITLACGPAVIADAPPEPDGAREVVYSYVGKVLGVSGDTVGRAVRRLADKVPDVALVEQETKVEGRKYKRHYIRTDDPTVRGLLSRASAVYEKRVPKTRTEKPKPIPCPNCGSAHATKETSIWCGCGVERNDLGRIPGVPVTTYPVDVTNGPQFAENSSTSTAQIAAREPATVAVTEEPASASAQAGDSDEWYTPASYIEAVRQALGAIDLDPASNIVAQAVVQAGIYYTKDDDGLAQPWAGRVWINPPYSNPRPWVDRLVAEYEAGTVEAGLILVNNATETGWFQRLLARYPTCFPAQRISFWRADRGVVKGNRQGQALFYLGPDPIRFSAAFAEMGQIVNLPSPETPIPAAFAQALDDPSCVECGAPVYFGVKRCDDCRRSAGGAS